MSGKIKTRAEIKEIAERLRKEGKKIVTINGSFDLLHNGHLSILQEAKEQGDILFVGVNSNKSIRIYKSKDRPIVDEKDRLEMLAALYCVDYVVLMDEPEIAVPLIRMVRPAVHVNGAEYGANCVEAPVVKEVGARMHLVQHKKKISTSELIAKIKSLPDK